MTTVAKLKKPGCPKCDKGRIIKHNDDGGDVAAECTCLRGFNLAQYLGPEILNAKKIESNLYIRNEEDPSKAVDRTKDNLFLSGAWETVCSHLQWALTGKWLESSDYTHKIINDSFILKVYFGEEQYLKKSKATRDEVETYSNLLDLMPRPDLMIIKLGFVESNTALPKALYEALKIRYPRPIWIAEGGRVFSSGHPAYSSRVSNHIREEFETIDLEDAETRKNKEAISEEAFDLGIGMGTDTDAPKSEELFDVPNKSDKSRYPKKRKNGGGLKDLEE
jgi:hypothetical protein